MFQKGIVKGELKELQLKLQENGVSKKKEAVKEVIAYMTVGKDVSSLFTDVLNCLETKDFEIKKLVYLYLIKYAKFKPNLSILVVNTLVKDTQDENPLVRALALRTMGSMKVEGVTEYLCQPLRKCLKDTSAYVRKTAVVCVVKLFDQNPELVKTQGFIKELKKLIGDSNPMVVSNALTVLQQINRTLQQPIFVITQNDSAKILNALKEATAWGQIYILDSISTYTPKDEEEAESIIEKVLLRLSHSNSSVVLSAVRVVLNMMHSVNNQEFLKTYSLKLASSLVTLLASPNPEIQYVALRNINLIVQRFPLMLPDQIRNFFCKYKDPIYVKMEKIEIIVMLVRKRNVRAVLKELKLYAEEVDLDFVKKSIRAIGRCALKLPPATEICVKALLELIKTKVNYIIQQVVIVARDIFRKYPNKYESIITSLCENLEKLDDNEAKCAMIWILGEYADRIDNVIELLESLIENFVEENREVQLQLLTSTVKLFLQKSEEAEELLVKVLDLVTKKINDSDLRDRGYIYWRLLSSSPKIAKSIVLQERPKISSSTFKYDQILLTELLRNIPTLSSVYHEPPRIFENNVKINLRESDSSDEDVGEAESSDGSDGSDKNQFTEKKKRKEKEKEKVNRKKKKNSKSEKIGSTKKTTTNLDLNTNTFTNTNNITNTNTNTNTNTTSMIGNLIDLTNLGIETNSKSDINEISSISNNNSNQNEIGESLGKMDFFSELNYKTEDFSIEIEPKKLLLDPKNGKGMKIEGAFRRRNKKIYFDLSVSNHNTFPIGQFALAMNKNTFGLKPSGFMLNDVVMPQQTRETSILCPIVNEHIQDNKLNTILDVAARYQSVINFFQVEASLNIFFSEEGKISKKEFLQRWKEIKEEDETVQEIDNIKFSDVYRLIDKFSQKNIYFIDKNHQDFVEILYFSIKMVNNVFVMLEVAVIQSSNKIHYSIRSSNNKFNHLVSDFLNELFKKITLK
ncbi:ap-1 complex subunit beta-1 [Anaeramoeba flamelloides]|uniref:Ap-1 complex subunit beta-1 n=1 Tax=Anaeramoeba flamelloides TaxID=1746091 RepID=A0ABQ8YST0_9EUKA|nr:ap-1 complex subunit beta-1 [Anaeramoeba flamelloides]